ncbi:hypothetical protein QQF64_024729 [Cirrhinus molitorella]|uniref:Prepronociceptin n=1 Tax=Cirrhinus molitorella TaxID=172907 RepID=A0ABR3NMM8_9TELE
MATICKICAGQIEPPDQRDHCVACLGLVHAEAALDDSNCGHCADLPARVLRARRDVARGLFGVRPAAASVPLVGPPSPDGESIALPPRRPQRSPRSPVSFSEDCFRAPSDIGGFVSFGQEEEVDLMSISASEREDWAGSEADQLDSAGTPDLQEELMRVLSKAVQELELTWSPPEEPARSKLDSWSRMSGRKHGVPGGSTKASGGARDATLARRRLLSRLPDGRKRGGECSMRHRSPRLRAVQSRRIHRLLRGMRRRI